MHAAALPAPAGNLTAPALTAADFELMQIYGSEFQPGAEIAAAVKDEAGSLTMEEMNNVVMVSASAFGAQVYPDSRYAMGWHKHTPGCGGSRIRLHHISHVYYLRCTADSLLSIRHSIH